MKHHSPPLTIDSPLDFEACSIIFFIVHAIRASSTGFLRVFPQKSWDFPSISPWFHHFLRDFLRNLAESQAAFYMIGGMSDVKEKAAKLAAVAAGK